MEAPRPGTRQTAPSKGSRTLHGAIRAGIHGLMAADRRPADLSHHSPRGTNF
jgi:hypothetical protein